ncbi:MAG: RnfABCDGE type electron transport complex subunit B [Candidatus Krumholzibacteriia bacterium]
MFVPTAVLAGMGLCSGLGLALAARFFAVETDPRQERVADALPGANCGGCGFAGCADFAAAVVAGKATPGDCPVCDAQARQAIGTIMGIEVEEGVRRVALVMCQGDDAVARPSFRYNGHASCASSDLLGGGDKLCLHGCLGLADCQAVCTFGAIEITDLGVARVLPERCTGCGRCIAVCPKHLIGLVPEDATIHVLCVNTDKGGPARKACDVACIGCRKCEKAFTEDPRIRVENNLARVDYSHAPHDPALVEACPTGALVFLDLRGGSGGPGATP